MWTLPFLITTADSYLLKCTEKHADPDPKNDPNPNPETKRTPTSKKLTLILWTPTLSNENLTEWTPTSFDPDPEMDSYLPQI